MERIKKMNWQTTVVGLVIAGATFAQHVGWIDGNVFAGIMGALAALGFIASADAKNGRK